MKGKVAFFYFFFFFSNIFKLSRSENRDYELPFMNRADRSERLEKLYRSLSLGPAESAAEQPINQNR